MPSASYYREQAALGFAHDGEADTFEKAKAQVEGNWQAWLSAAGLCERF